MKVEEFEVGKVAPDFICPYQIGTWRNSDVEGIGPHYLIELPAVLDPSAPAN